MKVISNYHWRDFRLGYEVPESVRADFDWLDEDSGSDGWISYRGAWYHVSDFLTLNHADSWEPWHGYSSDSFFSGTLIMLSDDGEQYKIGWYTS